MRIAVLGGTFDPIHLGHVQVADQVAAALDLDQVIFVPAGRPWMKPQPLASADDRLAMVELAIGHDERFISSRVDLDRPGPTYAVDTIGDLRQERGLSHPGEDASWYFIVGADALADFMHWHRPEQILQLAHVIGVNRPGTIQQPPPIPPERLSLLEIDAMDVSSSMIRDLVRRGASIEALVEASVDDYIREHGLYRDAST
jgi:nicotinate-nucleotide adenylyltransferase